MISVIIPVYNVEEYLKDCLDSVINQTYKDLQIILVDDGSTDNSGSICDEYAKIDSRVVVIHKENEGQGVARNVALNLVKGEYVFFVDGDDWIFKNTIQLLLELIQKYNVDLVDFDFFLTERRSFENLFQEKEKIEIIDTQELLKRYFLSQVSSTPWSKLYKKELWDRIRFPNIRKHEDAFILHEIFDNAKSILITNQKYYVQYIRQNSTMQKKIDKDNFFCIECGNRYVEFCKQKYPELLDCAISNLFQRQVYILQKITADNVKDLYKAEYKKIVKQAKNNYSIAKKYLQKNELKSAHEYLFPNCYKLKKGFCKIVFFPIRVLRKIKRIMVEKK